MRLARSTVPWTQAMDCHRASYKSNENNDLGGFRIMQHRLIEVTLALALAPGLVAQQSVAPRFAAGLQFGYRSGFMTDATITASDFAAGFPLSMRFGISHTTVEPGSAIEARRTFINNATNGIPEQSGRIWGFKLDLLKQISLLSLQRAYAFGGVRHARFTGNFKFIGGNEDFDINSNQWGLGGGVESHFAMGHRIDMVMAAGTEYFFASTLSGHDTSYSPNGDNINPREDYSYSDADAAVAQPKLEPSILLGISYRF